MNGLHRPHMNGNLSACSGVVRHSDGCLAPSNDPSFVVWLYIANVCTLSYVPPSVATLRVCWAAACPLEILCGVCQFLRLNPELPLNTNIQSFSNRSLIHLSYMVSCTQCLELTSAIPQQTQKPADPSHSFIKAQRSSLFTQHRVARNTHLLRPNHARNSFVAIDDVFCTPCELLFKSLLLVTTGRRRGFRSRSIAPYTSSVHAACSP
jgi:hypothetical protein